jgi:hypothetical protein
MEFKSIQPTPVKSTASQISDMFGDSLFIVDWVHCINQVMIALKLYYA